MKISERWLKEWTGEFSPEILFDRMTMAGLEIEGRTPVSGNFSGVTVAEVLAVDKHPQADRLHVCSVDCGKGTAPLCIVCGASNVRAGMKAALAGVGAILPDGMRIKPAKLRGVASEGMLCSAKELGLAEESEGIVELPADAPVGTDLREYLDLDDFVIEVAITPNRGDCLSVSGLAHEIAALTGQKSLSPEGIGPEIQPQNEMIFPVSVETPELCPRYVGRVMTGLNKQAVTPLWMQERLLRSGQRPIHPIVDVTNYVMLELGQPMHAFDLSGLHKGIEVRLARHGESLHLLDGREISLNTETLVIADGQGPLAIAGVMGGSASGVSENTDSLFLESAFFNPETVARASRFCQTVSESSFRFERGVDPLLQRRAIERATALILDIAGGTPGPVLDVMQDAEIPKPKSILLRKERLAQISGMVFSFDTVLRLLQQAEFGVKPVSEGWQVIVPARRFDIAKEIDLIEEVLRLNGYENIPATPPPECSHSSENGSADYSLSLLSRALSACGYHEAVTYTFVDKALQEYFSPLQNDIELVNPIVSDMNVMRSSLWPGLVSALQYNLNRQQDRVRIFETGKRFLRNEQGEIREESVISGLVAGSASALQWGDLARPADFFDVKGDIERLFEAVGKGGSFDCQKGSHPALHPGQTGEIFCLGGKIGVLGALHPGILQALGLSGPVFVFELLTDLLLSARLPEAEPPSRFPSVRRDLAFLVDRTGSASAIQGIIKKLGGEWLQSVTAFDVWQGEGMDPGKKSMAFALILQHPDRTLKDEEVVAVLQNIVRGMRQEFAAELRS